MPITPDQVEGFRNPSPLPYTLSDADQAIYETIPRFVDDQLQTVQVDASGSFPVVIPPDKASVLCTHTALVQSLIGAYTDAGWWIARALPQPDGSFALTLVLPAGRSGPGLL